MRALVRKGVFFECQYFFSLYDRLKVQSTLTVKKPHLQLLTIKQTKAVAV